MRDATEGGSSAGIMGISDGPAAMMKCCRKEARMNHRGRALAAIALAMALVVPQAKVRKTSKQMCEAHGGTYNAQTQQCAHTAPKTVSAQQACQQQGGVYWPQEQYCDFEE
jgi:hypothetical protein